MLSSTAGSLLLTIAVTSSLLTVASQQQDFPSIWASIRSDKSYHVMFKLQIFGLTQHLITVEEWASFERQLFRLDLITDSVRVTYLSNGKFGEIFRFKPFTCDRLSKGSKELGIIGKLFRGFNLSDNSSISHSDGGQVTAYGLGPLWLSASEGSKSIELVALDKLLSDDYVAYEVKFDESQEIGYDLRFIFAKESRNFFDAIEWIDTKANGDRSVEARALIIIKDTTLLADSVFELPIGFGCQRSPILDLNLAEQIWPEVLHPNGPNQIEFELATSKPLDRLLQEWDTQRHTVSITRGSLKLNDQMQDYFVTVSQARDHRTSQLWRIKRVWSSAENSTQAIVYTLNESTQSCQVNHWDSDDEHTWLTFPSQQISDSSTTSPTPLKLSLDLIRWLFNDNINYHLIRLQTDLKDSRLTEAFYEKRLETFDMMLDVWKGPVSILKKVSNYLESWDDFSLDKKTFVSKFQSQIVLFFYSQDKSQIIYKASIDLIKNNEIDFHLLLELIDIGQCFRDEQKKNIVVKYALEAQEVAVELAKYMDSIEKSFCLNLFKTTPIQPIQVSNFQIDLDIFYMYAKMTLIDIPLHQIYELRRGQTLAPISKIDESGSLIRQRSSSLDKCAASCDYYNCFRFAYDSTLSRCKLELSQGGTKLRSLFTSELYEPPESMKQSADINMRPHLRPQLVLRLLNEIVSQEGIDKNEEDFEYHPLRLKIDRTESGEEEDQRESIYLSPLSVHSDMDPINELLVDEMKPQNGQEASIQSMRAQYTLLLEDREFLVGLKKVGKNSGSDLTYDECAEACQDTNCLSFSYCESTRSCKLSKLHSLKSIESNAATKYAPKCSIFSLDYLSKFEQFGLVTRPYLYQSRPLEGISARECALICMEEKSFNCQSFYICSLSNEHAIKQQQLGASTRPKTVQQSCLMDVRHVTDPSNIQLIGNSLTGDQVLEIVSSRCELYSRSYLSQFDEFHEQAIESASTEVADDSTGSSADDCAKICIQRSCLAFDVCLDRSPQGKLSVKCHYLRQGEIRGNFLQPDKRQCTTFVLSDRSQFYLNKGSSSAMSEESGSKPDEIASDKPPASLSSEEMEATDDLKHDSRDTLDLLMNFPLDKQLSSEDNSNFSSHWLSKFLTCSIGVLFGVALVRLWHNREIIQTTARGLLWWRANL